MKLRPYQRDTLTAIYGAWSRGVTRPAVVKATGLGKTVTFSHLIARWCVQNPEGRVLVLVHRDELATQAQRKIRTIEPSLTVGIVKASQNEVGVRVIVASVQTLANERRRDQLRGIGLIVVDECHHAAALTWRAVLAHFGAWDGVPCVGFTATMHREDSKGLGEIWEEVAITRDIVWGVTHRYDPVSDLDVKCLPGERGYLLKPRGYRIRIPQLNLGDKSLIVAGDYQKDRVATAMMNADTGPAIARAVEQYVPGKRGVTFSPNVAAAENFAEYLDPLGGAEVITGKTPRHKRLAAFDRFESGHTLHLVTPMVLTEGWDAPWCEFVNIVRPTKNPGLFQQMLGRGLRPHGDQMECPILDYTGATDVVGLSSLADLGFDPPEVITPRKPKDDLDEEDLLDDLDDDPYLIPEPTPEPVARVEATEVDWFARVTYRWLTTRNGIPFLTAGQDVVFLWHSGFSGEVSWTVGLLPVNRKEVATQLAADLTVDEAKAKAEQIAAELGYVHRTEAWRNRLAPSGMIRGMARMGAGAKFPTTPTQGMVQDAIETFNAERSLGIV